MNTESALSSSFVILADESARWKAAGLYQLDRLVLGINEFAESLSPETIIDVVLFWNPEIPSATRWLPRHPKIKRVRLTESLTSAQPGARIVSTRLFLDRYGLAKFLAATPIVKMEEPIVEPVKPSRQLWDRFAAGCREMPGADAWKGWRYLKSLSDIPACEGKLLRGAGKSQDGLVSKFINRPISRMVTRVLLKYDTEPTTWTMSILILPIAAFFFLVRGDYAGIVTGALIFQFYSVLDGCDGEIARAKYLESERGARIDDFCDMLGSVLFVIGLGIGLFRSRASAYALEGILCAAVIVANEWLLRRAKIETGPDSIELNQILYPRHRALIEHSGLSMLGEKSAWWIIQLTKRDVAIFVFLLLALADLPQWILHAWIVVSAVTLILSAVTRFRVGANGRSFAPPNSQS